MENQERLLKRIFGNEADYLVGEPERIWASNPRANVQRTIAAIVSLLVSFLLVGVAPLILFIDVLLFPLLVPVCLALAWLLYLRIKIYFVKRIVEQD